MVSDTEAKLKLPGTDMITVAVGHGLSIEPGIAMGARLRKRNSGP